MTIGAGARRALRSDVGLSPAFSSVCLHPIGIRGWIGKREIVILQVTR